MAEDHNLTTGLRDSNGDIWGHKSRAKLAKTSRPAGAIIFVHGFKLFPDALSTWPDFPSSLQRQPKAAKYDLLFFGYHPRYSASANASKFREFLLALAENPAEEALNPSLASGLQLRARGYRHIVICAHSLGAIVSRLALLQCVDESNEPLDWLRRVKLILFGPAHMGADVLSLVDGVLEGLPLTTAVGAAIRHFYASLRDLPPGCQTLQEMREETQRLLDRDPRLFRHLRAHVAHGKKDRIVRQNRFLADHPTVQFEGCNHRTVCKPTDARPKPMRFLVNCLPE